MDNTLSNNDTPMAVKVTDLHKSYGQLEVLKGISLEECNLSPAINEFNNLKCRIGQV